MHDGSGRVLRCGGNRLYLCSFSQRGVHACAAWLTNVCVCFAGGRAVEAITYTTSSINIHLCCNKVGVDIMTGVGGCGTEHHLYTIIDSIFAQLVVVQV